jgi:hypothetical protein
MWVPDGRPKTPRVVNAVNIVTPLRAAVGLGHMLGARSDEAAQLVWRWAPVSSKAAAKSRNGKMAKKKSKRRKGRRRRSRSRSRRTCASKQCLALQHFWPTLLVAPNLFS